MHKFVRNLITEWRRLELPVENGTVVVGVSGGADSVSLLLAMHKLRETEKLDLRIVAAHFNHRLRDGESDADEEFVRRLTSEYRIEFAAGHAKALSNGNLEQNARNARYDFLKRTADNLQAYAVLTGHTINDQAETLLMNLIRGSGPEGLAGMRPVRELEEEKRGRGEEGKRGRGEEAVSEEDDPDTRVSDAQEATSPVLPFSPSPLLPVSPTPLLVRPLLTWAKRGDTEEYCDARGVEYRYDTMNEDTAFKRVRIRKILLPLLEDFNPKIIETLSNTAVLMQKLSDGALTRNHLAADCEIRLGDLKQLSQGELYDAIRSWLRNMRGTTRRLQLKHIQAIERLIKSRKSGKIAELPGGRVIKSGGRLIYEEN